ncbi:MAG: choice-of-anchor L domain-containing protein [Deltaproteobacteria bacterium]|nr:choice-of-anchor L domain-containing protein [Deltaproteobacteria bacterium]
MDWRHRPHVLRLSQAATVALVATALCATALGASACAGDDKPPPLAHPIGTGGAGGVTTSSSGSSSSGDGGEGGQENVIADPDGPCDDDIQASTEDPFDGARAVGLCKQAVGDDDWGVINAAWVRVDGADDIDVAHYDIGHGVLHRFGDRVHPHEGERLLVLSSGTARLPGQLGHESPAGYDKGYTGPSPDGYPKESPACEGVVTGATHDDVALEVTLRAPPDALSFGFDFNFFTYEWPDWVCSQFNDFFVALLQPPPDGLSDGNISFDQLGNSVSVNNAFVRVCDCDPEPPCLAPPPTPQIAYDCELGDDQLGDTGFEERAATGWLVTKAPVEPGAVIKLRWGVYDSGDGVLDSSTVIDHFRWLGDPADDPGTTPLR